jgi:hypothetical protein
MTAREPGCRPSRRPGHALVAAMWCLFRCIARTAAAARAGMLVGETAVGRARAETAGDEARPALQRSNLISGCAHDRE